MIDNHGQSPLMLAMENSSYDSAKMLVEAGANIYLCSDEVASCLSKIPHHTLLYRALNKYHEFVKTVLQKLRKDWRHDAQLLLKKLRDFGCTLFQVVSIGDASVTRLMLENGYPVNECLPETYETALHRAVYLADVENIKVLLEFDASIDTLDAEELPPMYYLYDRPIHSREDEEQRVEILKMFVEHGGLSIQVPEDLMTPANYILRYGNLGAINTLVQYDIEYTSFDALNCLVSNTNDDSLEVLRGKSFDVNAKNNTIASPLLSIAVCLGCLRKVQFLLEHGADPNAVDKIGKTPLITAFNAIGVSDVKENILPIVRLLLQYGANAQYQNAEAQKTVFDLAKSSKEVVESVIAHLAMIESCGVAISELFRRKIDSDDLYKQHLQVCKKQIEEMKGTTINGSVTLYKLLTESHMKITKYARDPEFDPKFEEAMKLKWYLDPYFSISIHKRVEKAIQEAKLKEEAVIVMNKILPCRLRNCTDIFGEILDYLSCDDLKNFCKV